METLNVPIEEFTTILGELLSSFVNALPVILGVVVVIILGWFLAKFADKLVRRSLRTLNAIFYRQWHSRFGIHTRLSPTVISICALAVRWTVFFIILIVALRTLEIQSLSNLLEHAIGQVPYVVAGMAIVFLGFVFAKLARDMLEITLRPSYGPQSVIFGRLVQYLIIITSLVMGVSQAGIDTSILVYIFAIVLAGLVGGMALAFGLGAKGLVANIIGCHHARKTLSIGQTIRAEGISGDIKSFQPSVIVLTTANGQQTLPGSCFLNASIEILETQEPGHG